ncbi:cellulose binding domain-containing protein [Actinocorallia longicatena]|uniref:CBM2 domain-containing protein n=1 Tax=Actinocorallia longicatena TaxID=111803 RepID=A0ABP6Q0N3_9ACTN
MNADEGQPTAEVVRPGAPGANVRPVRPDVRVAPATLTDGPGIAIEVGMATVTDGEGPGVTGAGPESAGDRHMETVTDAPVVPPAAEAADIGDTEELLRPKPDVMFAPVVEGPGDSPVGASWGGAHEVTGPQAAVGADGLPVGDESLTKPVAVVRAEAAQAGQAAFAAFPPPQGAYLPPQSGFAAPPPPGGAVYPPPAAAGRGARRSVLVAIVAVVGLLAIGAAAYMVWPSGEKKPVHQAAPVVSAAPTTPGGEAPGRAAPTGTAAPSASASPGASGSAAPSGTPQGTPAPVTGTTAAGMGIRYETSEVAPGYYEGSFTLTNNSGTALNAWTITFSVPGSVIDNVWGGTLTRTGSDVVITQDGTTAPIAPGESVTVRFGGAGTPATPGACRLNDQPCGW